MNSSKDFFLATLGAKVEPSIIKFDIAIQRENERKPFCVIKTNSKGKTFLRVGEDDTDGAIRVFI